MMNLYYVGRFVIRGKRIDKLLELSNCLEKNNCDYNIKIFADVNPNSEEYIMFENNSKFNFLGFKKDWIEYIGKDDIMIFVTEYEGCPLSILEAYKNNFKKIAVLEIPGIESYLSRNCIFKNVEQMSKALCNNLDMENTIDLSTYFDRERFNKEILDFYRFI
jgi:hypothetical protein